MEYYHYDDLDDLLDHIWVYVDAAISGRERPRVAEHERFEREGQQ